MSEVTEVTPEHPILRHVPNGLGVVRIIGAGVVAWHLWNTEPDERTWKHGLGTAAVAATDFWDGWWERRFGSTKRGPAIDLGADIVLTWLTQLVRTATGELPGVYPASKFGREAMVNVMRWAASKDGRGAIPVDSGGRRKTGIEMLSTVAANSPVSRSPDSMRALAAAGAALSLTSGAGYALQYLGREKQNLKSKPAETTSARNGIFRQMAASPNDTIAQFIHEQFPGVASNHLTHLGELLVEASAAVVLIKPELGFAMAAGPYTGGGLVDGVDGKHSRLKGTDGIIGMIKDVLADRRQELFTFAVNSLVANRHGNRVAASNYALGAATAALPSMFRAIAESRGHLVAEDAISSRVPRAVLNGAGLAFNDNREAADIISAMLALGNIITACQRADVVFRGSESPHYRGSNTNPDFIAEAAARKDVLIKVAVAGALIGAGLLVHEHAGILKLQERAASSRQKVGRRVNQWRREQRLAKEAALGAAA